MDQVRLPRQLAHSLECTAAEEEDTLVVVGAELALLVKKALVTREVLLIVYKIHLHTGRRYRAHLDDKLVVGIVDNEIHTRKADNLVQLVLALVHLIETRHKDSNLTSFFLCKRRQITPNIRIFILWHKRHNLLIDK